MQELVLKYGLNPQQKFARIYKKNATLPLRVLNGRAGYINLLDALNAWQLVRELQRATSMPSAASFKHVSPAGVGLALPLDEVLRKMYFVEEETLSPIATAYIRARGADRLSSYGDFVALSDICDESLAKYLKNEVSDGIIAPAYTKEALHILEQKRKGAYLILEIDKDYEPPKMESRDIFGITFEEERNNILITSDILQNIPTKNKNLPQNAVRDLLLALITLKYTQSNSVSYAMDGQAIGIGAGQQSRVHCTRLAGRKADLWQLRHMAKVLELPFRKDIKRPTRDNAIDTYLSDELEDAEKESILYPLFETKYPLLTKKEKKSYLAQITNVALASDAFFPFFDNIERAAQSGVSYIAQTGGSIRDQDVIKRADDYNIVMAMTGVRLFHH